MTTLREYCRGTWHPIWTVSLLSRQKRFVLRLSKKSFFKFNVAWNEGRPLATSSYACSLAKKLVLSTCSKSSSFPKPRVLPAVLFAH